MTNGRLLDGRFDEQYGFFLFLIEMEERSIRKCKYLYDIILCDISRDIIYKIMSYKYYIYSALISSAFFALIALIIVILIMPTAGAASSHDMLPLRHISHVASFLALSIGSRPSQKRP